MQGKEQRVCDHDAICGRVAIYGARGFAGEVDELIKARDGGAGRLSTAGFIVDPPYVDQPSVHGLPVHASLDWLTASPDILLVIAIGATVPRRRIAGEIEAALGRRFATLVHPRASLGASVTLGAGVIVCAGALASSDIALGDHSQLHAGAIIGHDGVIGDFVTVAPGAVVSGRVRIGEGTFVGAGAVILPDLTIGAWATIGAGAVVTRDVAARATVIGVPARERRSL
jgi:sugar O-acyltransferase (sialic acid O-acetyltransferase NeuD family)